MAIDGGKRIQKLELNWVGKDVRPRLEPRVLVEEPDKSYHAQVRRAGDHFDNRLIFGDNLLALKALEADPEVCGKVKCIFIDPPYNTGSAFEHYDDGVEHSIWLGLMRDRLEILRKLLSEDGSLWVTLDDHEAHYFKVMADEVFGRGNFVANVVWQARYSRSNDASLSMSHNAVLVYARRPDIWKTVRNRLSRSDAQASQYKNPDGDPKGPWRAIPWDAPNIRPNLEYTIVTPTGTARKPPPGRHWSRTEDQWLEIVAAGLAYFGKSGDGAPSFKQYLSEAGAIVPNTWWPHEEVGHTDEAKKEMQSLFGTEKAFSTPKPERLLERILTIATNPNDLVLDSFAGSGTTGAVAHKMRRRWILIELGDHAHTHIIPRLRKVVDNQDPGGVTESTAWSGGGGFRYYRLAPSLLKRDKWGQWVVNPSHKPEVLAEAVCLLEGYRYAPSASCFWQHGQSSESDFIYVTTATLNEAQLRELSLDVGPERSLLVMCGAWLGNADSLGNLTLKKIPKAVLARCEFDHDDYSLNVAQLPVQSAEALTAPVRPIKAPKPHTKSTAAAKPLSGNLFGDEEV